MQYAFHSVLKCKYGVVVFGVLSFRYLAYPSWVIERKNKKKRKKKGKKGKMGKEEEQGKRKKEI